MKNRFIYSLVAIAFIATATASAQNVTPDFGTAVPSSTVDRYDPTVFSLTNSTHGRNNVLNIGITSATNLASRAAPYQFSFYNTQGHNLAVNAAGSWMLQADLWVSQSWQTGSSTNLRRTDMWGVGSDGANPSAYSIIGFSNYDPTLNSPTTGLFRGYDINTGNWMNFSDQVNYDNWNTLAITFDNVTKQFDYWVNGSLAGSVVDASGLTTGLQGDIMQAYNFNDPAINANAQNTDYTAEWSNTPSTTATPEPASMALLATGLVGIGGVAIRRRKQQV